jgi:hypothetical protein
MEQVENDNTWCNIDLSNATGECVAQDSNYSKCEATFTYN